MVDLQRFVKQKVRPYSKVFPENKHIQEFLKKPDLISTDFRKKRTALFEKKMRLCQNKKR